MLARINKKLKAKGQRKRYQAYIETKEELEAIVELMLVKADCNFNKAFKVDYFPQFNILKPY
jgi:hypothetical protein